MYVSGRHRRIHTNPSTGSGGRGARNANANNIINAGVAQQHIATTIQTSQGPATIQLIPVQVAAPQFRGTQLTTAAQWAQAQQQQNNSNNTNNSGNSGANNNSSPPTPTPTTTS